MVPVSQQNHSHTTPLSLPPQPSAIIMMTVTQEMTFHPALPPLLKRNRSSPPKLSVPPGCRVRYKSLLQATLPVPATACCRPGPSYGSCLCFYLRPWAGSLPQCSGHDKILNTVSQYHSARCPSNSQKRLKYLDRYHTPKTQMPSPFSLP